MCEKALKKRGGIVVLTGPSGSGKTSLSRVLFEVFEDVYYSVSCTTRSPRDGEVDGEHYHFISEEEFMRGVQKGDFVEYARVHDHLYGTTKAEIQKAVDAGKILLLDIDVQGEANIRRLYECVLSIFITTPNLQILESRLHRREGDSQEAIQKRLAHALEEMQAIPHFDYLIINDDFAESKKRIIAIIEAFRSHVGRYHVQDFIKNWQ